MKTWHYEMFFVAIILATVAVCSQIFLGKGLVEWVGSLAVLLTFAHVQVAERLAEQAAKEEQVQGDATVDCHRWARRYLVSKEICWLVYFVFLGAYSALVGVGIFLLYPLWRHYYRKRNPLETL